MERTSKGRRYWWTLGAMIRTMLGKVSVYSLHFYSRILYCGFFFVTLFCIKTPTSRPSIYFFFSCFLRTGLLLTLAFALPFASRLVSVLIYNLAKKRERALHEVKFDPSATRNIQRFAGDHVRPGW